MEPRTDVALSPALVRARSLAAARDWPGLVRLARDLDPEWLRSAPELGYLCADAFHRVGETARALELTRALEPRVRRAGDRHLTLRLVNLTGVILFEAGRSDDAGQRFGELLEDAANWGDDEFCARASNNLGVLANIRGQRELALTFYQRALAAYQRLGHPRGLAQTHYNLGISYRDLGHLDAADAHYRRAIELAERTQSEDVVGLAEMERALLRVRLGDLALAERWAGRAQQRFERLGDPVRRAEAVRVLAGAARARGQDGAARAHLEEALAVALAHSNLLLLAEVQRDHGLLLRDLGETAAAREALRDAADHFERFGAQDEAAATRVEADRLD